MQLLWLHAFVFGCFCVCGAVAPRVDFDDDILRFRSWLDKKDELLCELPVEDIRTLTEEQLVARYIRKGQPVRLTHATDGWTASGAWGKEQFLERFGRFSASPQDSQGANLLRPASFESVFNGSLGDAGVRFFLRESENFELLTAIASEARWPGGAGWPADSLIRAREMRALSVSSRGASAQLHQNNEAWQAQVSGRKLWWLVRADYEAAKVGGEEGAHGFWGDDVCSYLKRRPAPLSASWRCVVGPGDAVFVPQNVFHGLCPLDDWTAAFGAQGAKAPLSYVHADSDSSKLEGAIDSGALALDEQDHGWTMAHWAAQDGHASILGVLLAKRSDMSATTKEKGYQPIHVAAMTGHASAIQMLASDDGSVRVKDAQGAQPLHLAAHHGHGLVIDQLLRHGARVGAVLESGVQPLFSAAVQGHVEAVTLLARHGAEVASATPKGEQPIYAASDRGHADVVTLLASLRAGVHAETLGGRHPIHAAARQGRASVVSALLSLRANVEQPDAKGGVPMHVAALAGHDALIDQLVDSGASVDARLPNGQQPMHLAAIKGHASTVTRLAALGASVAAPLDNGAQPLHAAAQAGHVPVVESLVSLRASASAVDVQGLRPVDYAAQSGHTALKQFFGAKRGRAPDAKRKKEL